MRCGNPSLSNTLTRAIEMQLKLQIIFIIHCRNQLTNFTAMMQALTQKRKKILPQMLTSQLLQHENIYLAQKKNMYVSGLFIY